MSKSVVTSIQISPRFLRMLDAPDMTKKLTFSIEAGGLLKCKAVYLTDLNYEEAEKEWNVQLCRTSEFYKMITGETS